MFIWEFEVGNVKKFAAKVGYHPNRISALKSATRGISTRLFRRMAEAYGLSKKTGILGQADAGHLTRWRRRFNRRPSGLLRRLSVHCPISWITSPATWPGCSYSAGVLWPSPSMKR